MTDDFPGRRTPETLVPPAAAQAVPPASLGEQHTSLFAVVTDALRRRILEGEYRQGERLVEGRLSEELGVSRIPVREALRALAAEGLVRIEPRRGASVAAVSDAVADELVEVRATLEGLNARLAAQRHSAEMAGRLRALLDEGQAAAREDRRDDLVAVNARVHDLVAEVASNEVLGDIMRSLRDRTALLFAPIHRGRAAENWADHAQILQAILGRDAELAALLAARHVHHAAAAYHAARAAAAPRQP